MNSARQFHLPVSPHLGTFLLFAIILLLLTPVRGRADTFSLAQTNVTVGAGATTESIVLATEPTTAPWTATTSVPWLQLNGGSASGVGSGNVLFTIEANSGITRTGSVTVADQTLTVIQAGASFAPSTAITSLVGSGLNSPTDVAVDTAGNVFIVDRTSSTVRKWTRANNTTNTVISTGLNLPNAVAVDRQGNLFIADSGNNAIKKWTASNSQLTSLVTNGLNNPTGIAVDPAGNVYVADRNNNAIKKWSVADSNVMTLVGTNLNAPIGVAVDFAANVYIADTFNGAIKKWTAATSNVTTIVSTGLSTPSDVAVDYAGNVYVANTASSNVRKWNAATGASTTLTSSGLLQPSGVAVDDAGNVYIASTQNAQVRELPRAFIDTAARTNTATPGVDSFVAALPASVNLNPPFAPTSSQPWLTIAGATNGVLTVNIATNSGATRVANLTVLGLTIPVTQLAPPVPEIAVFQPAGNNLVSGVSTNDFGPGLVNATNLTKTFFVTNSGGANLTGLALTIDGANPADFQLGNLGVTNLAPGANTSFTVAFQPSALGNRSATLHLLNNDPDENPFDITLVGVGIAATYSLSYSNLSVGPQTLVTNVTLTATPTNAPWTAVSDAPWLTVNPATSSGLGSTNLSLTIATNPGSLRIATLNVASVSLVITQAAAVRPEIAVFANGTDLADGATRDFGVSAVFATNGTQTLIITNAGSTNLTGIAVTKSGANAADFLVSTLATSVLAPGATTSFTISFVPNAVGSRSALLQIASNDSDENPFDITLTGVSVTPTYRLAATNRFVSPGASSDSILLSVTPANAPWTATTATPWLHITAGSQSGSGPAIVAFTADANSGVTRNGNITIAGQTLTVTQAGAGYVVAGVNTTVAASGLTNPYGIAVGPAGDLFIADSDGQAIKRWSPATNVLTTLIGSGLNFPAAVAADAAGNLYIADTLNNAIRKWTAANNSVSTLVATGLSNPSGLAVDAAGNVFIADTFNNAIKRWNVTNNTVTTLVDTGLQSPFGVAVDQAGTVYIADTYNSAIKRFNPNTGAVTTLVGSGLNFPYEVTVDVAGNVYIADSENSLIKKWTAANNTVTTLPFTGLLSPFGVTVDADGNVFVSDTGNRAIKALPRALVNPTARNLGFAAGADSLPVVLPASINLKAPFAPTSDQSWLTILSASNGVVSFAFTANPGTVPRHANINVLGQNVLITQAPQPFVATLGLTNWTVSSTAGSDSVLLSLVPVSGSNWTASSSVSWLHLAGTNASGTSSGTVVYTFDANPDSAPRTGALTIANQFLTVTQAGSNYLAANVVTPLVGSGLNLPHGVAVDASGNVFIADTYNNLLKRWSPADNTVVTLVSNGLNQPFALAADAAGNVFIADTYNNALKRWNVANGTVSSLVTTGLSLPFGIALDAAGDVYLADRNNNAIKKWSAANNSVTPVVSTGLNLPNGVAVDRLGNVYIADTYNGLIKRWNVANNTVTTLVSSGLNLPMEIAVDGGGNVYIADRNNSAIKKWNASNNTVTSLITSGLALPNCVAVNGQGDLFIADTFNNSVKAVPRAFVDQSTRIVGNSAAVYSLPVVLPTTANLKAPFLPTSNQPWLTINPSSAGNVNVSVSANSGSARAASVAVLGRSFSVNQTFVAVSPQLSVSRVPAGLVLNFTANNGQVYQIESAPAVTGPWTTNAILVGPPAGVLNYTNPVSTTGNRFFRTRTP